jgi:carboxypeptidase C (cathepsin A)
MEGYKLPAARWKEVAAQLSRLTGLSADFIERSNLRPAIFGFTKELRRSERLTVGRLDSRFTGRDYDATGAAFDEDPSNAAILGPFTATLNDYVRGELGYENDINYEILTGRVQPWSYAEFSGRYANVAEELRAAMGQNPNLKVMVANGYYDLATPFYATEYTFNHLGFEPDYAQRVSFHYYHSGHMMYIRKEDREKLKKDIAAFITANANVN